MSRLGNMLVHLTFSPQNAFNAYAFNANEFNANSRL